MQGSSDTVITDISENAPEGLAAGQSGEGMAESPGESSTNGTESGVPEPPEFGLQQTASEQMELSIPILPAKGRELSDFVAEGWELIDSVELDYNEDGIMDYVGVQEAMTDMPEGQKRSGLRILFGIASEGPGQYRLDFQDENLIPTFEEGGPFGDPYEPLTAEGTSFTTSAYGGSAWKGEHTYTYVYRDGNWYLDRSEESTWFIGPYTTDWVTDDWGRGVRTRRIQSDDREVMERRLEEQEEREDEEEYDLVYEMRLDEPPTLSQSGKRGWLAPDRVTDWEVREIQFAEGTGITPDGIDIVMPDEVYGFYYDENCVLYTFSNRVQEDRQKYYLAMYCWQDKSLTILTEGDGYVYICDPRYYRDKIYYITEVTEDVTYRSAEDEKDPVEEECRIGMRLKRIGADGTGEETIFEYMCPGLEEQPLAERPPWMNLRVRDISGGEIVVQVEIDGPDPVYRINVDGSGRRQIGQIPKESEITVDDFLTNIDRYLNIKSWSDDHRREEIAAEVMRELQLTEEDAQSRFGGYKEKDVHIFADMAYDTDGQYYDTYTFFMADDAKPAVRIYSSKESFYASDDIRFWSSDPQAAEMPKLHSSVEEGRRRIGEYLNAIDLEDRYKIVYRGMERKEDLGWLNTFFHYSVRERNTDGEETEWDAYVNEKLWFHYSPGAFYAELADGSFEKRQLCEWTGEGHRYLFAFSRDFHLEDGQAYFDGDTEVTIHRDGEGQGDFSYAFEDMDSIEGYWAVNDFTFDGIPDIAVTKGGVTNWGGWGNDIYVGDGQWEYHYGGSFDDIPSIDQPTETLRVSSRQGEGYYMDVAYRYEGGIFKKVAVLEERYLDDGYSVVASGSIYTVTDENGNQESYEDELPEKWAEFWDRGK